MELSEKLYNLRKKANMTQAGMADKMNVSRQTISKWELGTSVPSTENIMVLAKVFSVSPVYLLNEAIKSEEEISIEDHGDKTFIGKKSILKFKQIPLGILVVTVILMIGYITNSIMSAFLFILLIGFVVLSYKLVSLLVRVIKKYS